MKVINLLFLLCFDYVTKTDDMLSELTVHIMHVECNCNAELSPLFFA